MTTDVPRNRRLIEIKKWLIERGLTQRTIARKAGVSSMTVHLVIKGFCKSRRIEGVLRDFGCPDELLALRVA